MGDGDGCCEKYRRKGRACSDCPRLARLSKAERREVLAKARRRLTKKKRKRASK